MVTQLRQQLKELEEKVRSEEDKLGRLKINSKRSQHLVNKELVAAQRNM